MQKVVFIKTFGCQMNERDSEIIAQVLSPYGYVEGASEEDAELVVINTCSIRAKAEQKAMSMLGQLRKEKKKRPDLKICVAGCVAQQQGQKLLEKMPHIDLVLGTQQIYDIGDLLLQENQPGRVAANLQNSYTIPRFVPEQKGKDGNFQFKKFVTIMQGCNNFCTYCVVPYTRGREVSRAVTDIVEEIEILISQGVKEITLLGQNVNSYGKTNTVAEGNRQYDFADLLEEVASLSGLERLRFTTSNPKDLTDRLMRCFQDIPVLCPQFHLPVQSGSDMVLRRMNRKYTIKEYLGLVESLRKYRPEIALTTDVIVGFPGETDDDFGKTMELLETVRFSGSFSFKYSDRPGTASVKLADKVDEGIKGKRLQEFQKRQDEICLEENQKYLHQTLPVMVEDFDGRSIKTRTETNHLLHIESTSSPERGAIIDAEVTFCGKHSLKGRLLH